MEKFKVIDISKDLLLSEPVSGDTPAVTKTVENTETGEKRTILLSSVHNGTHITAPSSVLEGAKSLDEYPPESFLGECRVVKAKGDLTGAWIEKMSLYKCKKLLIKGEGTGKIDTSAAEELVASGVELIGIDSSALAIENFREEVRLILAEAGCLVLEGLNLEKVTMGTYFLISQPLLLEGIEAAPCRAFLAEDYFYWNR